MQQCWAQRPEDRPTAKQAEEALQKLEVESGGQQRQLQLTDGDYDEDEIAL